MKNMKKTVVLLTAIAVLLCATVGGTVAYLVTSTRSLTNTFTPSNVTIISEEKMSENVKNDVMIRNTGNTAAYIRAAVVVTWQDASGNVYGQVPVEGVDYRIDWTKDKWIGPKNGYYYYTSPVTPGNATGVLFTACEPTKAAPAEGYTLHVEIIAEAIQSTPTSVVRDNWGVTLSGTTITG